MPLEDLVGPDKYLDALNRDWPLDDDQRPQGDDHIRGVKNTLLNTFGSLDRLYEFAKAVFWNEPAAGQPQTTGTLPAAGGTTAQRPASPVAYDWRWNTEIETDGPALEFYDGSAWRRFAGQLEVDNFFRRIQYYYPGTEADPGSRTRLLWSPDGLFANRVGGVSVQVDDATAQDHRLTLFVMLGGVLTDVWRASAADQLETDMGELYVKGKRAVVADTPVFVGAGQTLAANGYRSWAHGLAFTPRLYRMVLQCVVTEQGYQVGDEIELASVTHTNDTQNNFETDSHTIWMSSTSIGVGSSGRMPLVSPKTGGASVRLSRSNWHAVPFIYG